MSTTTNTFVSFTSSQAAEYTEGRGSSYPPQIYDAILNYHEGRRGVVLDIGTGPGKVVFDLLSYFEHGVGCDPSASMVEEAKRIAEQRGHDDRTSFIVSNGERCNEALAESERPTADLIVCAMSAHWMDLPSFYSAAAKALRPGGTLAMWTCTSMYVHPSTPNAAAIQSVLSDLEDGMLQPYTTAGNMLSRQAYDTLLLPWTIVEPSASFDQASFWRREWDRGGIPSSPPNADGTLGPFINNNEESLADLEKGLSSASSVIRWRQANPENAHTEEDPVAVTIKRLREVSGGRERLILSGSYHLLLMRRM